MSILKFVKLKEEDLAKLQQSNAAVKEVLQGSKQETPGESSGPERTVPRGNASERQ